MIPFTPQQVHFLREIGDGYVLEDFRYRPRRYVVKGRAIKGNGLTASFNGLVARDALRFVTTGPYFQVTDEAKAQLREQVTTIAVCPACGRQVRTRDCAGTRFFVYHKHGLSACKGVNREAIFDEVLNA